MIDKLMQDLLLKKFDRAEWNEENSPFSAELMDLIPKARDGDFSSAHAFFEGAHPYTKQFSIVTDPTCMRVTVCAWPSGRIGENSILGKAWSVDEAPFAWVLASLHALIKDGPDRTDSVATPD